MNLFWLYRGREGASFLWSEWEKNIPLLSERVSGSDPVSPNRLEPRRETGSLPLTRSDKRGVASCPNLVSCLFVCFVVRFVLVPSCEFVVLVLKAELRIYPVDKERQIFSL